MGVVPRPVELIKAMPNEATNIPKDKTARLLTLISGVVLVVILKMMKEETNLILPVALFL